MMLRALECCGRQARWVLPLGLVGGLVFPWAAEPLSHLIAPCIGLLLFLSVLRLAGDGAFSLAEQKIRSLKSLLSGVLVAQLVFPLVVFALATLIGLPEQWRLAATLVAAASPISGSPNLVLLLRGNGTLALRWLIAGTVLLPWTCLPVLYLLFDGQAVSGLWLTSAKLLLLIVVSTTAGMLVTQGARKYNKRISCEALDGASAITLAVMVIGLMSALHAPDTTWRDVLITLIVAVAINAGYQFLGSVSARALKLPAVSIIGTGVINGNRNIALYLAALPASFTEPLLLFIACYQIPMYLTPLIGDYFYRRLE